MKINWKQKVRHAVPVSTFCLLAVYGAHVSAEVETDSVTTKKVTRSFETVNGNHVTVKKAGQTDHAGNARAGRAYTVTNAQGETVARGTDRVRKTDGGQTVRGKQREFTDADGNRY